MLFGSGIVVWAGVEASMLVCSEAGLILGAAATPVILLFCTSLGLE